LHGELAHQKTALKLHGNFCDAKAIHSGDFSQPAQPLESDEVWFAGCKNDVVKNIVGKNESENHHDENHRHRPHHMPPKFFEVIQKRHFSFVTHKIIYPPK
jgi:hypothetical protein